MEKTRSKDDGSDDLELEYQFDYSKARPNRFAASAKQGARSVLLEPDVAEVFTTPESVNKALRALIETTAKDRVTASTRCLLRSAVPGRRGPSRDPWRC